MGIRTYEQSFGRVQSINSFEEGVVKHQPFVSWGLLNDYVNGLYNSVDYSPIHNACLRSKQANVVGRGFTQDYRVNQNQTLNDIFPYIVYEYLVTGNVFLEVIWKKDRTQGLSAIHYIPSKYMRVGKELNEHHLPMDFWYSRNWDAWKKEKIVRFDSFDPSNFTEGRQMTYIRQYNPNYLFYGAPEWLSVYNDILLNHEITRFNLANIVNGLTPGLWVHINNAGNPTQREEVELLQKIESRYMGADNANKVILTFSDEPDSKPDITQLNRNVTEGYFTDIFELIQRQILSGHRIIDGSLIGLPSPQGLSNQSEQTQEAFRIFMNTCINPIQTFLTRELQPIIQLLHPEEEVRLEIIDNQPVNQ